MSKVFKAIGKVFKKVVKVAIKIAPYALAAAAVVFTGGAALGILPTFSAAVGGLVSSLGLSAAVTGALTGAVTSAGFGAALGFITGGKKGLKKGALMGALTGGVLGAVSPATFGIVKGADGIVTTTHQLAGQAANAASKGIAPVSAEIANPQIAGSLNAPTLSDVYGSLPQLEGTLPIAQETAAVLGDVAQAGSQAAVEQAGQGVQSLSESIKNGIAPVSSDLLNPQPLASLGTSDPSQFLTSPANAVSAATAEGSKGILSTLLGGSGGVGSNLTGLVGSVLQSIGKNDEYDDAAKAEVKARKDMANFAYGGVYTGNPNLLTTAMPAAIPQPRYYYDKNTNEIVDRQQPQGA